MAQDTTEYKNHFIMIIDFRNGSITGPSRQLFGWCRYNLQCIPNAVCFVFGRGYWQGGLRKAHLLYYCVKSSKDLVLKDESN